MNVVMIVEDEILEQEFLKSIAMEELTPEDTLLICDNGIDAVETARKYKPNIILMDVLIPEMDGLSAIKEIRNFLPNASIAVLSACCDFSYAQKAISLKVFEYLLKPVKPADFKKTFRKMLETASESDVSIEENSEEKILESMEYRQYFIEESVKYIKEHFRDKLTLQMVAAKAFMNPKYFSHVFKKELGTAFSEYVINVRVQHACRLLETTNYPAYRISIECGFSDPSYFNRVFCAQMNMTPQNYRKSTCISKSKNDKK